MICRMLLLLQECWYVWSAEGKIELLAGQDSNLCILPPKTPAYSGYTYVSAAIRSSSSGIFRRSDGLVLRPLLHKPSSAPSSTTFTTLKHTKKSWTKVLQKFQQWITNVSSRLWATLNPLLKTQLVMILRQLWVCSTHLSTLFLLINETKASRRHLRSTARCTTT